MEHTHKPRPLSTGGALLIVLIVLGRCADLASTYVASPDLTGEMNPFASVLGWGWFGLIMISVVVATILSAMVFHHFRYLHTYYPTRMMKRREFYRHLFYGGDHSALRVLLDPFIFRHRTVRRHFRNWFVFILPMTVMVTSFYASLHNMNVHLGGYGLLPTEYVKFTTVLVILSMIAGTWLWMRYNYRRFVVCLVMENIREVDSEV